MKKNCLTPIDVSIPPPHTQIIPRCATCKKFCVCSIREDYLKTAYLIQQILGDPQDDRELKPCCDYDFYGCDFEEPEKLFPINIETKYQGNEDSIIGVFQNAKYIDKDNIRVLYKIDDYLVVFKVEWDEEFSRYQFLDGKEIYYGVIFKIKYSEFDDTELQSWRQEQIKKEEENNDKDIINTTYFSATLNCCFYEQDKTLTEKTGLERLKLHCDSCCDSQYHHLATHHIEPNKVPCFNPTFTPFPILYPVFLPKPPCPPPKDYPQKRDNLNE